MDTDSDAGVEAGEAEDLRAQNLEEALAAIGVDTDEVGADDVRALLEEMAPVSVNEEGARPTVSARPTRPEALPAEDFDPAGAHQARIDGQFVAAERLERWVFRAVWWPFIFAVLYALL